MDILGLQQGTVRLVPYREEWPLLFEREKSLLLTTFPLIICAVEHIGSTSVPGLSSKPIVDIVVGVRALEDAEGIQDEMASLGYKYRGEQGRPERRLYVKSFESNHTNADFLVVHGDVEWNKLIMFRNLLRSNDNCAMNMRC